MPPPGRRKVPFSVKQKKKQLQERREARRDDLGDNEGFGLYGHKRGRGRRGRIGKRGVRGPFPHGGGTDETQSEDGSPVDIKRVNQQPAAGSSKDYDPNRYRLHFQKETREDIERRKAIAREPYEILSEVDLEMDVDAIYSPGSVLDMPQRPKWDYSMSKQQLNQHEETYFREYVENIMEKHDKDELSYFELNLETWRQLWRVLEMSDIVLLIADIRHPALHFSPALYNYVTQTLHKKLILVLNKIDLAPPALVVAWQHYMQSRYPGINVVCFTSHPKSAEEMELAINDPGKILHRARRKGNCPAVGPRELYHACETIVQGKANLSAWKEKIEAQLTVRDSDDLADEFITQVKIEDGDSSYLEQVPYKDGILTIGCCGYPNVGKSSLMNGLMGRKVVSVSKTPGHTKHFQTIFLTPNVILCDSPGLVFPSLVSKPMQILAGIYPIAQLREPYTAVEFLAQRLPLPNLLQLRHPDDESAAHETQSVAKFRWSAMDICEAWAQKRGFLTAKAARYDVYRAANNILRMALIGRLVLCMRPPGYTSHKASWEKNSETEKMEQVQQQHRYSRVQQLRRHTSSASSSEFEDEDESTPTSAVGAHAEKEESSEEEDLAASQNPFSLLADE